MLCEVDYEKHAKHNDPLDDALYKSRLESGFGGIIPLAGPQRTDGRVSGSQAD